MGTIVSTKRLPTTVIGDVHYKVMNIAGAQIVARTTAGVSQIQLGADYGIYQVKVDGIDEVAVVVWDDNNGEYREDKCEVVSSSVGSAAVQSVASALQVAASVVRPITWKSNHSVSATDSIVSDPMLTSPGGPCSCSLYVKIAAGTGNVISIGNAGNGIRLQRDGVNNTSWIMIVGGLEVTATYASIQADTWYHLAMRWGERDKHDGLPRQTLEIFVDGKLDASTNCGPPDAVPDSYVALWGDPYGDNSAMGYMIRPAIWNYALSNAEMFYASNGGHPISMRPSMRATHLLFCGDFDGDVAVDASDAHLGLTVRGTAPSLHAPAGLLEQAKPMNRPGNIPAAMFRGGYPVGFDMEMYLAECTDKTGTNYEPRPCYCPNEPGRKVRDMDFIWDYVTNQWLMGCINELLSISETGNGFGDSWGLYNSTSPDGIEWAHRRNVSCVAVTGVFQIGVHECRAWSPRFIIDPVNDGLHAFTCLSPVDGDFRIYEQHPIVRAEPLGPWSNPVLVTGTNFPINVETGEICMQGPQVHARGGVYYLVFVHWKEFDPQRMYVAIATSAVLTSGYTVIKGETAGDIDWAGWGNGPFEGPSLIERPDRHSLMNLDHIGEDAKFSATILSGTLAGVLDLSPWTTSADVLRMHGKYATGANFVPQGFMAHTMPGSNDELSLADDLVLYAPLASNSLDHFASNDLTNNGGVLFNAPGKITATAANMIAAQQHSFSAPGANFPVGFNSWCAGVFIKFRSLTANQGIITRDDYGTGVRLWNGYFDIAKFRIVAQKHLGPDGGFKEVIADRFGPPVIDKWMLMIVGYDYVLDEYYIDVDGAINSTTSTGLGDGNAPLRFGGFTNNGVGADHFDGQMNGAFYYNRTLTLDERAYIRAGRELTFVSEAPEEPAPIDVGPSVLEALGLNLPQSLAAFQDFFAANADNKSIQDLTTPSNLRVTVSD